MVTLATPRVLVKVVAPALNVLVSVVAPADNVPASVVPPPDANVAASR